MHLEYGPPAVQGVTQLQYMGDVGDGISISDVAKPIAALALGTWAFAWATGKETLKKQALGVSIASFLIAALTR